MGATPRAGKGKPRPGALRSLLPNHTSRSGRRGAGSGTTWARSGGALPGSRPGGSLVPASQRPPAPPPPPAPGLRAVAPAGQAAPDAERGAALCGGSPAPCRGLPASSTTPALPGPRAWPLPGALGSPGPWPSAHSLRRAGLRGAGAAGRRAPGLRAGWRAGGQADRPPAPSPALGINRGARARPSCPHSRKGGGGGKEGERERKDRGRGTQCRGGVTRISSAPSRSREPWQPPCAARRPAPPGCSPLPPLPTGLPPPAGRACGPTGLASRAGSGRQAGR